MAGFGVIGLSGCQTSSGSGTTDPGTGPLSPGGVANPLVGDDTPVISAEDLIEVVVQRQPEFSVTRRVANDGTLYTPILGKIQLAGLLPEEAEAVIRDRLVDGYLVDPVVTVIVVERAKKKFVILGQVKSPGYYSVPGELQVTLVQAVAMAGGYTRIAGDVVVTREVNGEETTIRINRKNSNADAAFTIMAGDTVEVEESLF